MRQLKNILVTGGSGFIGSNFIRYSFLNKGFEGRIINADKLSYAGNPMNLTDIDRDYGGKSYFFHKVDICDTDAVTELFRTYDIDTVVHFAAESHVDRSLLGPAEFLKTNINGTFTLIEAARAYWKDREGALFHHVSTDEVFGSLGAQGAFKESTPYDPRSPYSATKASSDHLVRAVHHSYGLPITISNCSNNYGPYQFPEKMIPLMILNIFAEKPLPVYGDGSNIRDWLYVGDHAIAIWDIMEKGKTGETYLVGGENEWQNIDLVKALCRKIALLDGKDEKYYLKLLSFVKDRPGHDKRYAIDCSKIKKELGWKQTVDFSEGLDETIAWYRNNTDWVEGVRSGEYKKWLEKNYSFR